MPDDRRRLGDVQEMSAPEMTVYEAVAALIVDRRPATPAAIARMTGLPDHTVRRCLGHLVDAGRVLPKGDAYLLGPHDWGLEY